MEVAVYNIQGQDTGRRVDLSNEGFAVEQPNDHAIYMDVRQYLANQRQGTHKAKERGEVHGTNKKPFRQKGTGNARQGDRKSPLFRHGGTICGPRPRDYKSRLNKKVKRLARKSALTYKAREEEIRVIENFEFEAPKTKRFVEVMDNLQLGHKKVLVVLENSSENIYLSGRNLPKASVMTADMVSTYDILNAETLIMTEGAVSVINKHLAKKA